MGSRGSVDRVWLTGAMVCLLSLLLGDFLVFKANRLVAGEGAGLGATPWTGAALLIWVGLCAGSLAADPRWRKLSAVSGALLLLLLLFLAGHRSTLLLTGHPDFARVSLGSGFWGALFGLFIALVHAVKILPGRWLKPLVAGALGGGLLLLLTTGSLDSLSLAREYAAKQDRFAGELLAHLKITFLAVGASSLIGFPLGLLLVRRDRIQRPVFSFLNTVQTIPSLALFGLLIAPLAALSAHFELLRKLGITGIGWAPAVIALTLYALLPVVRNTFVGFRSLDQDTLQAGRGMGMTGLQLFLRVELPLAAPLLLNGIRVSGVQTVGNTAVAALIGAGGFGVFIFQGLGQGAADLILLGALPTVLLAVLFDLSMQGLIAATTPRGVS
jgi:osmoprotectant transport system permease protein